MIKTIEDVSEFARHLDRKGDNVIFVSEKALESIRDAFTEIDMHYAQGGCFASFNNSPELAKDLGFISIYIDGCSLHFGTNFQLFIEKLKEQQ